MSESIALLDAEATRRVGCALGEVLKAHADAHILIGLSGKLGAGKTTFVGGVLAANAIAGSIRSPTYTLIEPYELPDSSRTIYHLDLYRLRSPVELEELGVRELLSGNNVLLIEWIESAPALADACDLRLELSYAPGGRVLQASGRTPIGRAMAQAFSGR